MQVRPAVAADAAAIQALMAPEVDAGRLLPRVFEAQDFLVVELHGRVWGAVALQALSGEVAELCALVAGLRGVGIGGALVDAAMAWAGARGFRSVVALTNSPEFFTHAGFRYHPDAPWALARGEATRAAAPEPGDEVAAAARLKAGAHCAGCERLHRCTQWMVTRSCAVAQARCA
jgi:N-acetylglutamate synthase-like GNAT family acetyltransferase